MPTAPRLPLLLPLRPNPNRSNFSVKFFIKNLPRRSFTDHPRQFFSCNFRSLIDFSRSFRKFSGMSPRQFREDARRKK